MNLLTGWYKWRVPFGRVRLAIVGLEPCSGLPKGYYAVRRFSVEIRGGKSWMRGLEMMNLCPFSRKL